MTKNKKQDQPIGHLHFNINNNILLFMRGNKKWRTQKFLQASITNQKNSEASVKNLETQVGQLAKQLFEQQSDLFLAIIQTNPKQQCNFMTSKDIDNGDQLNDGNVFEDVNANKLIIQKDVQKNDMREKGEVVNEDQPKNEEGSGRREIEKIKKNKKLKEMKKKKSYMQIMLCGIQEKVSILSLYV